MTAAAMPSFTRRTTAIVGGVVLFHVALLWALNTGLLRRAAEVIVPVQMLSELTTPPAPKVEPAPLPVQQPVARRKPSPVPPAPVHQQVAPRLPPSPNAPTAVPEPQTPAPPIVAAPAPAPVAPPAPAKIELPSTSAEYLQNPPPTYPATSRRLGEQGTVIVRVLIGADGLAQEAELRKSSGFDRLDRAALETVRKWRYVPGKRGGVPEAMWFNVPINFVLE